MSDTAADDRQTLARRSGDSLDERIADVERQARDAWVILARERRWTLWVRVSWSWPVSDSTAHRHLRTWATKMRTKVPGMAMLAGVHSDTDRRHAHLLLFIPRRWVAPLPAGITRVGWCWESWLEWPHGTVWVERYSPGRTAHGHGAAEYLARDVGSVDLVGTAPPYHPRRHR